MKEFWDKYSRIIFQAIVVCASVGLMIYFMPREKYESLHYEVNKPWEHEQLIAEFDFQVKKSNEEINAEKENIRRSTEAHFDKHDIGKEKIEELRTLIMESEIDSLQRETYKSIYNNLLRRMLKEYYDIGIISDNDAETIKANNYRTPKNANAGNFVTRSTALAELGKACNNAGGPIHEWLELSVEANWTLDSISTNNRLDSLYRQIDPVITSLIKGQRIINSGDIINEEKLRTIDTYFGLLKELEKGEEKGYKEYIFYGQLIFIVIVMTSLIFYLVLYQRDIIEHKNKFAFTIISVTIFPTITGIMLATSNASIYILPFAIGPAMMCLFINSSTAIVTHMASILICSAIFKSPYEFIILQLTAGFTAILSLKELSSRAQMFKCAFTTLLTYSTVYLCYILIKEADISKLSHSMYAYFIISSSLMTLIYPIMLIVEKTFGFVSSVTLIELSNFNNKLLQKLSQVTPGTFQHSIQVGNLAAEAAGEVGANTLEVRTGALYHDIGKTENPIYFTENQSGGISPHNALTPVESARVIIKHVTDGIAIARREKLPKKIQEFIATHHGLSKTGYFYITYKNEHPDEKIDESIFTYPGPQPHTKEQAILMMADCVEAASHSLKEYTEENISTMVDNIIDPKVKSGEFSLSPLTFQDIDKIKKTFKKRLMAIYHTRISYPTEKKKS